MTSPVVNRSLSALRTTGHECSIRRKESKGLPCGSPEIQSECLLTAGLVIQHTIAQILDNVNSCFPPRSRDTIEVLLYE